RRADRGDAGRGFGAGERAAVGGPLRRPAGRDVQRAGLVGLPGADGVGDRGGSGRGRVVFVADDPVRGRAVRGRGTGALHGFRQCRDRRGGVGGRGQRDGGG